MQVHSCQNASASGGLRPPDPLPGLSPWTPLGDFRPPDPLIYTPPKKKFSKNLPPPFKISGSATVLFE